MKVIGFQHLAFPPEFPVLIRADNKIGRLLENQVFKQVEVVSLAVKQKSNPLGGL
ncbi:MAG: hypothetical protein H6559_21055 [Lewinellaceae bacterium]|nr:hypothetical protein [Lewinellaceae bacterium]